MTLKINDDSTHKFLQDLEDLVHDGKAEVEPIYYTGHSRRGTEAQASSSLDCMPSSSVGLRFNPCGSQAAYNNNNSSIPNTNSQSFCNNTRKQQQHHSHANNHQHQSGRLKRGKAYRYVSNGNVNEVFCFIASDSVVYRLGDSVYIDNQFVDRPYFIGTIQRFKYTKRDQLNVLVKWYFRPCEIPEDVYQSLVHDRRLESSTTVDGNSVHHLIDSRLESRELFISDAIDSYPVSSLRGRCVVHHLKDIGALPFRDRKKFCIDDDWFFYLLCYNPENSRLASIVGEIRVGSSHQARLPEFKGHLILADNGNSIANLGGKNDDRKILTSMTPEDDQVRETLIWFPEKIDDLDMQMFISAVQSSVISADAAERGNFNEIQSTVVRDQIMFVAHDILHTNSYNVIAALTQIHQEYKPSEGGKTFTDEEGKKFIRGIKLYGKNFFKIRQELLQHKSTNQLIEHYYLWKKSPAATAQRPRQRQKRPQTTILRRIKAVNVTNGKNQRPASNEFLELSSASEDECDSDLSDVKDLSGYACHHCYTTTSKNWHHAGKNRTLLCFDCRVYFKKYGEVRPLNGRSRTPPPFLFAPVNDNGSAFEVSPAKDQRQQETTPGVKTRRGLKNGCASVATALFSLEKSPDSKRLKSRTPTAEMEKANRSPLGTDKKSPRNKNGKRKQNSFDDSLSVLNDVASTSGELTSSNMPSAQLELTPSKLIIVEGSGSSSNTSPRKIGKRTKRESPKNSNAPASPASSPSPTSSSLSSTDGSLAARAQSTSGQYEKSKTEMSVQSNSDQFHVMERASENFMAEDGSHSFDEESSNSGDLSLPCNKEPSINNSKIGLPLDGVKGHILKSDDFDCHRSKNSIFRRVIVRGESDSCCRTDFVFVPASDSVFALRRLEKAQKKTFESNSRNIKQECTENMERNDSFVSSSRSPCHSSTIDSMASYSQRLRNFVEAAASSGSVQQTAVSTNELRPIISDSLNQRLHPSESGVVGQSRPPVLKNLSRSSPSSSRLPPPRSTAQATASSVGINPPALAPSRCSVAALQTTAPILPTAETQLAPSSSDHHILEGHFLTLAARHDRLKLAYAQNPSHLLRSELEHVTALMTAAATAAVAAAASQQHHTHSHTHSHTHLHIHPSAGASGLQSARSGSVPVSENGRHPPASSGLSMMASSSFGVDSISSRLPVSNCMVPPSVPSTLLAPPTPVATPLIAAATTALPRPPPMQPMDLVSSFAHHYPSLWRNDNGPDSSAAAAFNAAAALNALHATSHSGVAPPEALAAAFNILNQTPARGPLMFDPLNFLPSGLLPPGLNPAAAINYFPSPFGAPTSSLNLSSSVNDAGFYSPPLHHQVLGDALAAERLQQLQFHELQRRLLNEHEFVYGQHAFVQHNDMMRRLQQEGATFANSILQSQMGGMAPNTLRPPNTTPFEKP